MAGGASAWPGGMHRLCGRSVRQRTGAGQLCVYRPVQCRVRVSRRIHQRNGSAVWRGQVGEGSCAREPGTKKGGVGMCVGVPGTKAKCPLGYSPRPPHLPLAPRLLQQRHAWGLGQGCQTQRGPCDASWPQRGAHPALASPSGPSGSPHSWPATPSCCSHGTKAKGGDHAQICDTTDRSPATFEPHSVGFPDYRLQVDETACKHQPMPHNCEK